MAREVAVTGSLLTALIVVAFGVLCVILGFVIGNWWTEHDLVDEVEEFAVLKGVLNNGEKNDENVTKGIRHDNVD